MKVTFYIRESGIEKAKAPIVSQAWGRSSEVSVLGSEPGFNRRGCHVRKKFHPGHKYHSPHCHGTCVSIMPYLGESDFRLSSIYPIVSQKWSKLLGKLNHTHLLRKQATLPLLCWIWLPVYRNIVTMWQENLMSKWSCLISLSSRCVKPTIYCFGPAKALGLEWVNGPKIQQ